MDDGDQVMVAAWELEETVGAVEAASLLLELLITGQYMDAEHDRNAPRLAASLLHLATERLRSLCNALRNGEAGDLLTSFNSALDTPETRRIHSILLPVARPVPTSVAEKKPTKKAKSR